MLGNLPDHLQAKMKFDNIFHFILATQNTFQLINIPIKLLLKHKMNGFLIAKLRTLGTFIEAPDYILNYIVLHDDLVLYQKLKPVFRTFFKNSNHFTKTIMATNKINIPNDITLELLSNTPILHNLTLPRLKQWFYSTLMTGQFEIAFKLLQIYPDLSDDLFKDIFKRLLTNLISLTAWEELNPGSTYSEKWQSLKTLGHFKLFWNSNFPGGIGLYHISSTHTNTFHGSSFTFQPKNILYFPQFHRFLHNKQTRIATCKKLKKLAYIISHSKKVLASEVGIPLNMATYVRTWTWNQSNIPNTKFQNDVDELASYYNFLADVIENFHPSVQLLRNKEPLKPDFIINYIRNKSIEIQSKLEPLEKKLSESHPGGSIKSDDIRFLSSCNPIIKKILYLRDEAKVYARLKAKIKSSL